MEQVSNSLRRFIDTIIPLECRETDHDLLRSRILVVILLLLIVAETVLYFSLDKLINFTPTGAKLTGDMVSLLLVSSSTVLVLFRLTKNRLLAAHLITTVIWYVLAFTTFFTGGIETPTLSLFILLPVLVGVIAGSRSGLYWTLIVTATWLTFLLIDRAGFQFEQIVIPQNYHTALTICLSVSCLLVTAVIIQYEVINRHLREELSRERSDFEHMARHDQLTGLPNRRHFMHQLELVARRASRTNTRFALLFFDLDKFKDVNDVHGHSAGDELLKQVAARLSARFRSTDSVARWGGDEFAMILENIGSEQEVRLLADILLEEITTPVSFGGLSLLVGASIGAAVYPDHSEDCEELLALADKAMYHAKQNNLAFRVTPLKPSLMT